LDHTIDVILTRGDATAALRDPELAPLARVSADLRHYPGPQFKARLRASLERRATMSSAIVSTKVREGFTTITPYLRVREAGLVDFLNRVFGAVETFSAQGGAGGVHREVRIGNSMIMIGEVDPKASCHSAPPSFTSTWRTSMLPFSARSPRARHRSASLLTAHTASGQDL